MHIATLFQSRLYHAPHVIHSTVVVYTEAARAGLRHETFARSAGEMLGAENLPAFTAGTDLILPVSANQDLRETLMLPESVAADWRIHSHAINHNCFESEVHVPQVGRPLMGSFILVVCGVDIVF